MDAIDCRKTGLNKEFIAGLTPLLFENKIQKKEVTAKEKELVFVEHFKIFSNKLFIYYNKITLDI